MTTKTIGLGYKTKPMLSSGLSAREPCLSLCPQAIMRWGHGDVASLCLRSFLTPRSLMFDWLLNSFTDWSFSYTTISWRQKKKIKSEISEGKDKEQVLNLIRRRFVHMLVSLTKTLTLAWQLWSVKWWIRGKLESALSIKLEKSSINTVHLPVILISTFIHSGSWNNYKSVFIITATSSPMAYFSVFFGWLDGETVFFVLWPVRFNMLNGREILVYKVQSVHFSLWMNVSYVLPPGCTFLVVLFRVQI